jgi:Lrp/AsnC family transcriptional regulator for asnA, asnC and gidA
MIARDHEHMRKLLYEKIIDTIQGLQKRSMIELGCAFKEIFLVILLKYP